MYFYETNFESDFEENEAQGFENYQHRIDKLARVLKDADAIAVGIGNGLSICGGSGHVSARLVRKWFPQYYEMGFSKMSEIQAVYWRVNDDNILSYWGYWANFIMQIRYRMRVQHEYAMLQDLILGKKYYVCTTNVDGQANRAGIPKEKIFSPQGDYGLFQCSEPCCDKVYDNEESIIKMCSSIDREGKISRESVPYCPQCGAPMIPNVRFGDGYAAEHHMGNYRNYENFILENRYGNLVFLECGVEFNAPEVIRSPFERLAENIDNARLVRINSRNCNVPENLKFKSIAFPEETARVFADVLFAMNQCTYMVK